MAYAAAFALAPSEDVAVGGDGEAVDTARQARQAGDYEAALAASRRLQPQPWAAPPSSQDDPDLAAAIAASLQPAPSEGAALRDLARPDAAGADPDLAAAIAASLADVRAGTDVAGGAAGRGEEEEALQRALALSRQAGTAAAGGLGCEEAPIELSDDDGGATEGDEPEEPAGEALAPPPPPSAEEVRAARLRRFG